MQSRIKVSQVLIFCRISVCVPFFKIGVHFSTFNSLNFLSTASVVTTAIWFNRSLLLILLVSIIKSSLNTTHAFERYLSEYNLRSKVKLSLVFRSRHFFPRRSRGFSFFPGIEGC